MPDRAQPPLITIGITSYREGVQLQQCWDSVLAQTDERWLAVLVLDGGHDAETRAVFDSLTHPRLRKVAVAVNQGPYPMRNLAFELTETPYHFYLDGDDQLVPESVALVLAAIARAPDAAIVVGDYAYFDGGSGVKQYPQDVRPDRFSPALRLHARASARSRKSAVTWTQLAPGMPIRASCRASEASPWAGGLGPRSVGSQDVVGLSRLSSESPMRTQVARINSCSSRQGSGVSGAVSRCTRTCDFRSHCSRL